MNSFEIATWTGAIATVLAVLVALFKDDIWQWWHRPRLTATIRLSSPDCQKMKITYSDLRTGAILGQVDCYYLRIWIENKGNLRAERVQVYAARLLRRHADGILKQEMQFLPMNLRWSHSQQAPGGPEIFADGISPLMGKHCDLGHIFDPSQPRSHDTLPNVPEDQTILVLDLEVPPSTGSHLIGPGLYQLELKIAAANSKPVTKIIEINLTGQWYDEQSTMFSDGIGIKEVA